MLSTDEGTASDYSAYGASGLGSSLGLSSLGSYGYDSSSYGLASLLGGTSSGSSLSELLGGSSSLSGLSALLGGTSSLGALSGLSSLGLDSYSSYSSGSYLASLLGSASGSQLRTDSGYTSLYDGLIAQAASQYGVDPALVKGVIQAESSFRSDAESSAGAKGLMQLMDGTAQGLGVTDSFDAVQNIDGGTRYLSYLLRKYNGNEATALAAYNAGPGRVDKLGITTNEELLSKLGQLPEETQAYIGKVLSNRSLWSSAL
ncbi:lytic transglycosylase domain-containing protein [Cohnella fermenti]|uniref:Lytic transglycosylase domain-containing protein n=2 Tax=Cohnella fermenti TaxID=2565925 RepID=A0A4S4BMZ9_9BACL|nr:lytic transglycosylase domain-containing protein [Cohnella fermenti]